MGWQDHDPARYERITGLAYATDLPLDGSPPRVPTGWEPPPMPVTCPACTASGDYIRDGFDLGDCLTCGVVVCRECGNPDDDCDGTRYTCEPCHKKENTG